MKKKRKYETMKNKDLSEYFGAQKSDPVFDQVD